MSLQFEQNNFFSVYIEKNVQNEQNNNSSSEFKRDDVMNRALNNIYPKYINKWIDSSLVLNCQNCNIKFGYFEGKHHCRSCGCVYCYKCCNKYIKIPDIIKKPKEENSYKQQLVNLCKHNNKNLVCKICYDKIKNLEEIDYFLNIAEFFDLETLYKVIKINKKWYNACIHYLSKFRDIQYKINTEYDDWEYNIMTYSKKMLIKHSVWKLHLIKCNLQMFYKKGKIENELYDDKNRNKNRKSCWNFMCSRKCCIDLDLFDFIDILKFVVQLNDKNNILWENEILKRYIINILHNICKISNDINYQIIKSMMPLFCSVMSLLLNESIDIIDINFVNNIFDEINIYDDFKESLCDEIRYLEKTVNELKTMGNINLYDIVKKYFKNINDEEIINMNNVIIKMMDDKKTELDIPILYPLNYGWKIIKVIKCVIMKSNSSPLLFDVVISNKKENRNVKFLVKKENTLRKEHLVSCIIKLLLIKLKCYEVANNKYNGMIPIYEIKMISKDVGIIEFVENSKTLREITDMGYTMQNYILEHNKNISIDIIKTRFINSLSISCCICYLLGLADRHTDNLMINNDGQIFNIDYSYILEIPKTNLFGSVNIKITNEMIDFLGGVKSNYYHNFKEKLVKNYDIMRLYKEIIIYYYELMNNENFLNFSMYREKLENKFMIGMKIDNVKFVLINEIETSSLSNTFNDTCHILGNIFRKK